MSVEVLDLMTPAPPFDLVEGDAHACIDIVGVLLVAPPFACLAGGPFDTHACIDIVGVINVATPFACYTATEIVADCGVGCVESMSPLADLAAAVGVGLNSLGTVFGNGDWPPHGGAHSLPNNAILEVGTMFQVCRAEQGRIIDRQLAATAWKPGNMEVHLFTNDIDPTVDTLLTDLTEATFDGYAAITDLDMHAKSLDNDDNFETVAKTTSQFVCTGPTVPETVHGYYIKDFNGNLVGAERFDESQAMAKDGDSISFTFHFAYPIPGAAIVTP